MSPLLATTLGTALYAVVLLPVAYLAFHGSALKVIGCFSAFVIALAVYQTGIFHLSSLTPVDAVRQSAAPVGDAQCREIVALMKEAGLGIDRSDPAAPKIVGEGAEQIPSDVRDVLITCTESEDAEGPAGPARPAR